MKYEDIQLCLAPVGNLARLARLSGDVAKEYHNVGHGEHALTDEQIDRARDSIRALQGALREMQRNIDNLVKARGE